MTGVALHLPCSLPALETFLLPGLGPQASALSCPSSSSLAHLIQRPSSKCHLRAGSTQISICSPYTSSNSGVNSNRLPERVFGVSSIVSSIGIGLNRPKARTAPQLHTTASLPASQFVADPPPFQLLSLSPGRTLSQHPSSGTSINTVGFTFRTPHGITRDLLASSDQHPSTSRNPSAGPPARPTSRPPCPAARVHLARPPAL